MSHERSSQPYSHRADPSVPAFPDEGPVTVMDATCGLCAKGARWIAHHDKAGEFRIIPDQSALGVALMMHYGLDSKDPTSWLYLEEGIPYVSAEAIIRCAQRLGGVWRVAVVLRIVPKPLLHRAYLWMARNRYRLSGRADLCNLPDVEIQSRLLQ